TSVVLSFRLRSPATADISSLSLHDALPISARAIIRAAGSSIAIRSRMLAPSFVTMTVPLAPTSILSRPDGPSVDRRAVATAFPRSEEHTSELQSRFDLVCRLLLENNNHQYY